MDHADPAILIDHDGRRRPLTDVASGAAVAWLLRDKGARDFLMSAGLEPQVRGEGVQVPIPSLLGALSSAAARLPSAPHGVRVSLAQHNLRAASLLHLARALESVTTLGDASMMVPWGDARPALTLVRAQSDPADSLLAMDRIDPSNVDAFLRDLAALSSDRSLSKAVLAEALIPLLQDEATVGAAATVLARFGVESAVEGIERALSRVQSLDNRLQVISALVKLGRRELGLRTLRSIIRHGDPQGRRRAVETLAAAAQPEDRPFLREVIAVVSSCERLIIAAALYGLGEQAAYATIAEVVDKLEPDTPAGDAATALRTLESLRSRRFTPLAVAYSARETRPLLSRQARRVADALQQGVVEPSPAELMDKAEQAYFHARPAEAREHLELLVKLGCRNPRGLYIYANCLKDEGDQEDALLAADNALLVDASYWRSHRLRGSLLWDLGRHEESLEAYDRALNLNPVDPYTWYYKGYVLYRLRRDDEALPCLDRALSLKADSPYIHNQKAFCLERLGRHEEAVRCYQKSLQLRSDDLTIRDYLGQAMQQCGRLVDALNCYDQVLAADDSRSEARYHRADVLYDLERWEEAAAAFASYVELEPESYNGWFYRGLCLRFIETYAEAAECFRKALLLRPDSVNARRHLVFCDQHL